MSAPLSLAKARETVDAVQAAINAGYKLNGSPSAVQFLSHKLGLAPATIYSRLTIAKRDHGLEPLDAPEPVVATPIVETINKPRVRVKMHTGSDAPIYRVLGIGDAHDHPGLPDKSRFKWMAKHAAQMKPDYVVQIGDFASFDSLSSHDKPGSLPQKLRPSYLADIESLEAALSAFHRYGAGINCHVTLGNHEGRVQRYERGTAEIEGTLFQPLLDLFARYGWRSHDEGQFFFCGGIGFVHAPRTLMGREYGGKTLNAIANDAIYSIVFGHSHRGQVLHAPKIGPLSSVTICNLGTCLPTGYVAEYAKVSTTGWTYGVYELTIQAGKIVGHSFISMDELERRYA